MPLNILSRQYKAVSSLGEQKKLFRYAILPAGPFQHLCVRVLDWAVAREILEVTIDWKAVN
jgi:hypothetical protein